MESILTIVGTARRVGGGGGEKAEESAKGGLAERNMERGL